MGEQKYYVVKPSYQFRIENTNIQGYVTACTVKDAMDILSNIHLGPKEVIEIEWEGKKEKVIRSASIIINKEVFTEIPIQISDVKES